MASGIVRSDSTVETITLTKTSNATSATLVCQRYGKLCVVYVKSVTMASSCTGTYRNFPIATGCPIPIGRTEASPSCAVNIDGSSAESYLSVESDGSLMMNVRHTAINSKTLMGSIVYFTE